MSNGLIYKSYPTILVTIFSISFLLLPCPFLMDNMYVCWAYIILVIYSVSFFLLKRYYFYNDRVEILHIVRNKKEIIYFNQIEKIQFRIAISVRSPPQIVVMTKAEPKKAYKSFIIYSTKKTKYLLNELHNLGLKIEFAGDKEYIAKVKSW